VMQNKRFLEVRKHPSHTSDLNWLWCGVFMFTSPFHSFIWFICIHVILLFQGRLSTKFIPEEYPEGFKGHKLSPVEEENLIAVAAAVHKIRLHRDRQISGRVRQSEREREKSNDNLFYKSPNFSMNSRCFRFVSFVMEIRYQVLRMTLNKKTLLSKFIDMGKAKISLSPPKLKQRRKTSQSHFATKSIM
jgi:hypothetical protein